MKRSSRFAGFGIAKLSRWLLLAPLALLIGTAAPVRAAHLDEALLSAAPEILMQLEKHKIKIVGVLPFKVKKGTRQASYLGAPVSSTLPGRLENALIMSQGSNESKAIGVIRDAAGTANKQKVGSFLRNPVAFNKLFDTWYPLAWGSRKVQPDAFLTGIVENVGDRSKTTLQLQLMTKKSRQGGTVKLIALDVPIELKTDRSLLRDLGYTFALSRGMTKPGVTSRGRDQQATQQVSQQEKGQKQQQQGQSGALTPTNIAGIAFELRYDGVKQPLRRIAQSQQGSKSPVYEVDPMPPGAKVSMVLTPLLPDDKKLGVVLKVNGKSTWQEEDDESLKCRKWIYDVDRKGKEDEFEGIYSDAAGKNLRPWGVLTAAESAKRANEFGDKAGWIDIDVFATAENKEESDQEDLKISTRGLARPKKKFTTLKSLQTSLREANNVKVKKAVTAKRTTGGLLLADSEPAGEVEISTSSFPNPVRIGGISIRYYDAKSGGGEREDLDPE